MAFTESTVKEAAVDWPKELGDEYAVGPEIASDGFICTRLATLRELQAETQEELPPCSASGMLRETRCRRPRA
jgi:hypothetical protein